MRLSDRLAEASGDDGSVVEADERVVEVVDVVSVPTRPEVLGSSATSGDAVAGSGRGALGSLRRVDTLARTIEDSGPADPMGALQERLVESLFERLGGRFSGAEVSEEELWDVVRDELATILREERIPLNAEERTVLIRHLTENVMGYGPIRRFLDDPAVTEIMVTSTRNIYVEREGRLHQTASRFVSDVHLRQVIQRIVGQIGRRVDESSPMVDARLPDGSRVNAIIPPLSVDGPSLTIRKFSATPLRTEDLISFGTMTREVADLLAAAVLGRLNVLISGGTGSGKTTLLNVLSSYIPESERIVTIEDAVELRLDQEHVVRLEARMANIEGKGEVTIRELVRNSLRMRPDRIVVGEVRSSEALDMLQAMNTGHEGSLGTLHANTPRDALSRLETMVLMAGMDLPMRAIREQIASAIDLVVQIARLRDGTRRIVSITEVVGMEGDVVTLQDIFTFDYAAGVDASGRFRGSARPTGLRPMFADRLAEVGIEIPASVFGVVPETGSRRRS